MAKHDHTETYDFPDVAAPDAVKGTMKYGNQVANFIANEWFYRDSGLSRFYNDRYEMERLRLYARGAQSTEKYKRELAVDGDLSYLNLDWEPVPVIPKFRDLIVNGIMDRLYDVTATAQDKSSVMQRKNDIAILRGEMKNKEMLLGMQEQTGVDVFENDPASLPANEDELQVFTQLNYKQKSEIGAETAVSYVFNSNRFEEIRRQVSIDITEIGKGIVKHCFDPQQGVKIEYVDPADVVHSYSEDPNFKDVYYIGEIKRINIGDLMQMYPDLSPDMLKKVRQSAATYYDYHGISYEQVQGDNDEQREANKCEVMQFCWKSTRRDIHKIRKNRKGGDTAVKRDETFEGPKTDDAQFQKTERIEEVIYEGFKVMGGDDDLLLKWELQKNMTRPKSSTAEVVLPYVMVAPNMHKGRLDSMVKRITKYADMIQLTYLKIQQVIQKVVPPGIYVDADGLAEIDLGNGTQYNPREALNMFFQTGSIIGRSMTSEGDRNPGAVPIQEIPGSQGQQLLTLLQTQQYWYDQIRLATGINEARDAADPDPRALVGVQKMLAANSNVCTRHILDGGLMLAKKVAEAVVLRMQDVMEFHPLKEQYRMAIGKENVNAIDALDGFHLHDFGVFLELEPDEEQKQFLEGNIQQALASQQIHLDDAIDVRQIKNLKLANQVLKVRRKRKYEEDMEMQAQQAKAQSEGAVQAAQAAEQAKQQTMQMTAQFDQQKLQLESQLKMQALQAEKEAEKEILMLKAQLEQQTAQMQNMATSQENSKDRQSNEKQAKMKDQGGVGGASKIGLGNKQNTIDNKVKGAGYLQQ